MRVRFATALMLFAFAYAALAFAADPTDDRLIADVAVAKATIILLQSRDGSRGHFSNFSSFHNRVSSVDRMLWRSKIFCSSAPG
jgi:hypothetical protein